MGVEGQVHFCSALGANTLINKIPVRPHRAFPHQQTAGLWRAGGGKGQLGVVTCPHPLLSPGHPVEMQRLSLVLSWVPPPAGTFSVIVTTREVLDCGWGEGLQRMGTSRCLPVGSCEACIMFVS